MKIRAGFELLYDCPQPTPMILQVSVQPSRQADLISWDGLQVSPPIPANTYHDTFGNFCHVIRAPAGRLRLATDFLVQDSGVCRDYAHLAVALCRCMNVPARYCTGYLGDMGTEPPYGPGDFAAWFEAYLGGRWHIFDPRNNVPRIGRILMARGRDATDVAMVTSFGPCTLAGFKVFTDEVAEATATA